MKTLIFPIVMLLAFIGGPAVAQNTASTSGVNPLNSSSIHYWKGDAPIQVMHPVLAGHVGAVTNPIADDHFAMNHIGRCNVPAHAYVKIGDYLNGIRVYTRHNGEFRKTRSY